MKNKKTVVIQGLGFVGAAMAVAVARKVSEKKESIHSVIGVELPTEEGQKKIKSINSGFLPFETNDLLLS